MTSLDWRLNYPPRATAPSWPRYAARLHRWGFRLVPWKLRKPDAEGDCGSAAGLHRFCAPPIRSHRIPCCRIPTHRIPSTPRRSTTRLAPRLTMLLISFRWKWYGIGWDGLLLHMHCSLLTTHYLPPRTHYSLVATHFSLLLTPHSPLPTQHALLSTPYSPLPTRRSLLHQEAPAKLGTDATRALLFGFSQGPT